MAQNDTITIFEKTMNVVTSSIASIENTLEDVTNSQFKMILINSMETLKERNETLKEHLKKEQNVQQIASATNSSNSTVTPAHCDRQIASGLFDDCNTAVKEIYTYLNHYKDLEKDAKKLIKEAVKAVERLREQLADYL